MLLAACPGGTLGIYSKQGSRDSCKPCTKEFYSLPGSTACSLCNVGYFAQPVVSNSPSRTATDGHQIICGKCLSGMVCNEVSQALRTVRIQEDYWRLSTQSRTAYRCLLGTDGGSACRGGRTVGEDGSGYCRPGHMGPLCQVCFQPSGSSDEPSYGSHSSYDVETEKEGEEEGEEKGRARRVCE